MHLNMDRQQAAHVIFSSEDWSPSPVVGVDRVRFERAGEESGWATSVVRYAAESQFHEHSHPRGEEIFILDGIFSDEQGDYPAGTYIRNPDPSPHSPSSRDGCVLFVRLCQMKPEQDAQITLNTNNLAWQSHEKGYEMKHLYQDGFETIEVQRHARDTTFSFTDGDLLIVSGKLSMDGTEFPPYSWIRAPRTQSITVAGNEAAIILVKKGHLE